MTPAERAAPCGSGDHRERRPRADPGPGHRRLRRSRGAAGAAARPGRLPRRAALPDRGAAAALRGARRDRGRRPGGDPGHRARRAQHRPSRRAGHRPAVRHAHHAHLPGRGGPAGRALGSARRAQRAGAGRSAAGAAAAGRAGRRLGHCGEPSGPDVSVPPTDRSTHLRRWCPAAAPPAIRATCTMGRRCTSGSAWRSTSRVTGAVSPLPSSTYLARWASGLPSDHWKCRCGRRPVSSRIRSMIAASALGAAGLCTRSTR